MFTKDNLFKITAVLLIPGAIPAIIGYVIVNKVKEKFSKAKK